MGRKISQQHLDDWNDLQTLAEKMIPIVGELYRKREIVLKVFGRKLMTSSSIEIVKAHRFGRLMKGKTLDMHKSFEMLETLSKMRLTPCRVDLGALCHDYLENHASSSMDDYLKEQLAPSIAIGEIEKQDSRDIVLYGFGRIGRILTRLLIDRTGSGAKMRLRGVVVRAKGDFEADLEKRASLLRRDSIHGEFKGSIQIDRENLALIVNGAYVQFIYANSPDSIDYTQYGIKDALIVDNTGIWTDEQSLGQHLKSRGVSKVLLTAPAKGEIPNIVYGVNCDKINPEDKIICAASCTTNAIVPVLKVMDDKFGIVSGHIETIHSYTNDQNLIDNYHAKDRRGRSAPLNMVLTSTGAAKAVTKVLGAELGEKLTGNAIRVPTPNVSMAVMNLNLDKETSKEELQEMFRDISYESPLRDQVGYTWSTEVVSSDLVGSSQAGVVDGEAIIADGKRVVLYVWYDNEAGYSNQVVRVMQDYVGLKWHKYPA
jgi:glyceraldehyde 3-phosphate dehydrogenase